ncbi:MAG: T9SS type A sorting domain-containing protein [Phaeodactylibacter sp.]|nr:T9SS type A sorting domain-containing protein [Phaeodactylibacter sp.]
MRLNHYSLLLALLLSALSVFGQQHVAVTVQSNSFTPKDITISVGDTVTWTNIGGTHNINGTQATFPDNPVGFTSGVASSSPWTYSFVFNTPGFYDYHCDPHFSLGMTGTVTVQAPQATSLILTGVFDGPLSGGLPKGIELYVLDDIADLSAYGVGSANNGSGSGGVEYTFPAVSATAGSYLYLTATESASFNAFFGFDPDFVDEGSPASVSINGDDAIELFLNGAVVDVFGEINVDGTGQPWEYMDGWAYRVDGTGPDGSTFVLSNWMFSGIDVYDPAATNAAANPAMPVGTYDPNGAVSLAANDDQAMSINGQPITIHVLANDVTPAAITSLTITMGPDNGMASVMPDNTILYTPADGFCGSDSFVYELCDANGCETATVSIDVACYPAYSIGQVNTVDAEGVADSLGVICELHGIVYGVDLQASGLQFTLIDESHDGIGVFNGSSELGYTVQEGDEVVVLGEIGQFRGLTQIVVESIELVSTGNALFPPTIVTGLGEDTESQLVKLEAVRLVNPAQWDSSIPSGFNVDVTNGTDTFAVRIHEMVDLYNMPAPQGIFNVAGLGGQFDSSSPYLEGYQLLPRYMEDIDVISAVKETTNEALANIFPNPTQDLLTIELNAAVSIITITDALGRELLRISQPGSRETISLGHFQPGLYVVVVRGERAWAEKLIISR